MSYSVSQKDLLFISVIIIVILNIAAYYVLLILSLYIFCTHIGLLLVLPTVLHLEVLSQTQDSSSLVHCSLVNVRA